MMADTLTTPTPASPLTRTMPWPGRDAPAVEPILNREWLVTNGLGGYASGTVSGVMTRRFHGLLIAALPTPYGRRMMLNGLVETLRLQDGTGVSLGGSEHVTDGVRVEGAEYLSEFRLESGLPLWVYRVGDIVLEKQLVMPYLQNTVHMTYRLREGRGPLRIELRPALQFRPHEGELGQPFQHPYTLIALEDRFEFSADARTPALRVTILGQETAFTYQREMLPEMLYRIEARRGYESQGTLFSPGYFRAYLDHEQDCTLVASTEPWETVCAMRPGEASEFERQRRRHLIDQAAPVAREGMGAELVLAADQFVIAPVGRVEDTARARAGGDEIRSVIAGYHWFTDWGRDTMISLEGLTISTGRHREAGWILRTFAHYVRGGLIPNFFPDGHTSGVYHTADASLWFFQAMHRYLLATGDQATLRLVLPKLEEILRAHLEGTRFGIGVDHSDGLLRQGAPGYQLTWMDAKVDDWVVTPRRGKAVEINALWHNALLLSANWMRQLDQPGKAEELERHAARCRETFNERFWYAEGNHLYDVVDGEDGTDDPACRPNQVLAVSLTHPVLDRQRWQPVMETVRDRLLTPVGLRSLSPDHPDYKSRYDGDLRARDAAYHQGTVWGWLIGPYIDAYLKLHPEDKAGARRLLEGFGPHLGEACIGSISEVFDAEDPYMARGCCAQAWSVAEVLRCWVATGE